VIDYESLAIFLPSEICIPIRPSTLTNGESYFETNNIIKQIEYDVSSYIISLGYDLTPTSYDFEQWLNDMESVYSAGNDIDMEYAVFLRRNAEVVYKYYYNIVNLTNINKGVL
jgi:hypothetical protein